MNLVEFCKQYLNKEENEKPFIPFHTPIEIQEIIKNLDEFKEVKEIIFLSAPVQEIKTPFEISFVSVMTHKVTEKIFEQLKDKIIYLYAIGTSPDIYEPINDELGIWSYPTLVNVDKWFPFKKIIINYNPEVPFTKQSKKDLLNQIDDMITNNIITAPSKRFIFLRYTTKAEYPEKKISKEENKYIIID